MRSKFICISFGAATLKLAHHCSLIAKWKKAGYEKLCCLRCIQTKVRIVFGVFLSANPDLVLQDMNYQGSTCICRVPKAQLRQGTVVECVHCGKFLPPLRRRTSF